MQPLLGNLFLLLAASLVQRLQTRPNHLRHRLLGLQLHPLNHNHLHHLLWVSPSNLLLLLLCHSLKNALWFRLNYGHLASPFYLHIVEISCHCFRKPPLSFNRSDLEVRLLFCNLLLHHLFSRLGVLQFNHHQLILLINKLLLLLLFPLLQPLVLLSSLQSRFQQFTHPQSLWHQFVLVLLLLWLDVDILLVLS